MQRIINKNGFTLGEVLIATLILGFCLTNMMVLITKCTLATETFKNQTIAINHIHGVFEEIRMTNDTDTIVAQDWSTWGRNNNYTILDANGCVPANFVTDDDCEKIKVTYPSGEVDPLEILIIVTWKDRNNAQRELKAVSILTKR